MSEQVSGFPLSTLHLYSGNRSTRLNVQEVLGAALIFQYDNRHELRWGAGCQYKKKKSVTSRRPVKLTFYIMPLCLGSHLCRYWAMLPCASALRWVQTQYYKQSRRRNRRRRGGRCSPLSTVSIWDRGGTSLILSLTVTSLSSQHATVCGQVLFSVAKHAPAMASVMEIQPLFSRLTCRENSVCSFCVCWYQEKGDCVRNAPGSLLFRRKPGEMLE